MMKLIFIIWNHMKLIQRQFLNSLNLTMLIYLFRQINLDFGKPSQTKLDL